MIVGTSTLTVGLEKHTMTENWSITARGRERGDGEGMSFFKVDKLIDVKQWILLLFEQQ